MFSVACQLDCRTQERSIAVASVSQDSYQQIVTELELMLRSPELKLLLGAKPIISIARADKESMSYIVVSEDKCAKVDISTSNRQLQIAKSVAVGCPVAH